MNKLLKFGVGKNRTQVSYVFEMKEGLFTDFICSLNVSEESKAPRFMIELDQL